MKAKLDQTYLWNRQCWGPGEVEIPDSLAIALGLIKDEGEEVNEGSDPSPPSQTIPALTRINQATSPKEIAPLPTIGFKAALKIFGKRPEGGYISIEQIAELCPELTKHPFQVNWETVEAWEEG
jgi:hypothetical protein